MISAILVFIKNVFNLTRHLSYSALVELYLLHWSIGLEGIVISDDAQFYCIHPRASSWGFCSENNTCQPFCSPSPPFVIEVGRLRDRQLN